MSNTCIRCVSNGTVFASFSTNNFYAQNVYNLAHSVVKYAHVPCLCMAMTSFPTVAPNIVEPIVLDNSKFPIGKKYCNNMAGWRLHSFLNPTLIVYLLSQGHNVFSVDADWKMVRPLSALPNYDVVALQDHAPNGHYLNVGLMYIRSTNTSIVTWRRIANRSHSAWDQSIANEEIAASAASCCSWNSDLNMSFIKDIRIHNHKNSTTHACYTNQSITLAPPNMHSYPIWKTHGFNFDNLHRQHTRCTKVCRHDRI
jgi:hypothetical protein